MQNLVPVDFEDDQTLRTLISRKPNDRRSRLVANIDSILKRYEEYRSHKSELSQINNSMLQEPLSGDCHSFYSSEPDELVTLKKAILDKQPAIVRAFCQYCSIGEPKQFDHYASQGRFPEFSIFSLNLIPCCGNCNLIKHEGWTHNGNRQFINFYYDTFIQHQLLHAAFRFHPNDELSVEFSIQAHPSVTASQLSVIKSHMTKLDLFNRYSERATGVVSEVLKKLPLIVGGIAEISNELALDAGIKATVFGANHWASAVYRCMSTSERFIALSLGDGWLPRAYSEVANLLCLAESAATNERIRALVQTRAWRRYCSRGMMDGYDVLDWNDARAELGLPDSRWI